MFIVLFNVLISLVCLKHFLCYFCSELLLLRDPSSDLKTNVIQSLYNRRVHFLFFHIYTYLKSKANMICQSKTRLLPLEQQFWEVESRLQFSKPVTNQYKA